MYVCLCHAVTDSHIADAVQNGARHLKDISKKLKVTTTCGRCRRCARDCLKSECEKQQNPIAQQEPSLDCAV